MVCGWRRPPGTMIQMSSAGATPLTEREGLIEFLDLQREALINKLNDLSDADARRTATVSSLSLLSLVKHSATWERRWFQVIAAGYAFPGEWPEVRSEDVDSTFQVSGDDTVDSVVAYYRDQIVVSNEIVGGRDLDAPCAWPEMAHRNLRWVAMHMIEETARHAGHADIIRESIDGQRGL